MASQTQQLENPAPPTLGYPTEVYERRHFNENNGSLTIYFKKLASVLGSLFGPRGGRFMNAPYGAFQDSTDQVAANTTTAYAVTFNTTDFALWPMPESGTCSFPFSLQIRQMRLKMWMSGFGSMAQMWPIQTVDLDLHLEKVLATRITSLQP